MIQLSYSIAGKTKVFETALPQILIGREAQAGAGVDLSLLDPSVSRAHARISAADGLYWLTGMSSTTGTTLNGHLLAPDERRPLQREDKIRLGAITLRVVAVGAPPDETAEKTAPLDVAKQDRWDALVALVAQSAQASAASHDFYRKIVEFTAQYVPAADTAALIIRKDGKLYCLAHTGPEPQVSQAILECAMDRQSTVLWPDDDPNLPSGTQRELAMQAALCAPLLAEGQVLGALLASYHRTLPHSFTAEDRRLLGVLAHFVAGVVRLETWRNEALDLQRTQQRLLAHFSPLLHKPILEHARAHHFRPGGERIKHAAVLMADLRGFTKLSAGMEPGEILTMLNTVFARFNEVIFRSDGIVDKFIGDAILAIFGEPFGKGAPEWRAVQAADEMRHALTELNAERQHRSMTPLHMGIGIHCGPLVHGFVGTEEKNEFTIIGDTVNQCSRYVAAAQTGEIFMSPESYNPLFKVLAAERQTRQTKDGLREGYLFQRFKN
jgi:class 3 adenylate cyclase